MLPLLSPSNMFSGKMLPSFLRRFAPLYEALVLEEGIDKVVKVYDYTFRLLSGMTWGQFMRLDRVCPDVTKRQLFFWCLEMIYQSDLLSQMRFARRDGHDIIEIVPPGDRARRLSVLLGDHRYIYIDWYRRLLADPACNTDIRPEWLLLDAPSADEPEPMAQSEIESIPY